MASYSKIYDLSMEDCENIDMYYHNGVKKGLRLNSNGYDWPQH